MIISTVGGVEICLDPESICHIFDIALVGLKVYKSKMWPIVLGLELREVIQRICELPDAQEMGKPLPHSLTVINRVLHHILCSIFLPRSGHWDEVSYYEAFLIDSILTERRIHLLCHHSLSLLTVTYHLIKHLLLLTMLHWWIYLLILAL